MSSNEPVKVLTLQPFYGGSHRHFVDAWVQHSRLEWECLTLPARHWKWRMRHSAIEFARQVDDRWRAGRWEAILCTDMLNLAEFKGLCKSPAKNLPTVVYFHENQFEYPDHDNNPRDLHFAFSNITTLLAADAGWFNSQFNLESLLEHFQKWLKIWPDFQPKDAVRDIRDRSRVFYPGISVDEIDVPVGTSARESSLHLVWASRWEHDKNPEGLYEILSGIADKIDFRLSVVGEQYAACPSVFATIRERFGDVILDWGFQKRRQDYLAILSQADVILSTAHHEFFGISVVEAMALGCIPLLPNRLSYPELLRVEDCPERKRFLYESNEEAMAKLIEMDEIADRDQVVSELKNEIANRFDWVQTARELDNGIESLVSAHNTTAVLN